jgi:hypothetical protein
MIGGWAWDSARPTAPIDVHVAVSNGREMTVSAADFRADLLALRKGDGRHAFTVDTSPLAIGPGTWTVRAEVAATGVPLAGSPATIVCPD